MCSASQAGCESHGMWELKKLKFRTDPVIDGYWITLRSSYLTSRSSHWLSVNDRILFRSVEDINIKASKFQKLKSRVGSSCSNLLHCSILLSTSVFYWRVCAQLCSFNFHPGLQNLAGKGPSAFSAIWASRAHLLFCAKEENKAHLQAIQLPPQWA